jgi:hypothetical protein
VIFLLSLLFFIPIVRSVDISKRIIDDYVSSQRVPNQNAVAYHAIIIANSTTRSKKLGIYSGVDLIIKDLESKKCEYKICLCNTPGEAQIEIEKPRAKFIYLHGHGFKGGLIFYNSDSTPRLEYIHVNPDNKKEFIAQFHCNDGDKVSLIEHLLTKSSNEENYYFKKGWTTAFIIWYDIRLKVLNKIKKC